MTTEIETHPSETGGTTSKTRSDRLPAQPAVFLLGIIEEVPVSLSFWGLPLLYEDFELFLKITNFAVGKIIINLLN